MIPISSLVYKKDCFLKDSLLDVKRIEYDVFYAEHLKSSYFPFFVFYNHLFKIVDRIDNEKSIRIDNLEELIFYDLNVYFFEKGLAKNISDISRIEKISRTIASEIFDILNLVNESVIVGNKTKVNFSIKTIGSHSYFHTFIDLAFFTKDEKLKMYLFQPFKNYTSINIKTALCYFFWNEISNVDSLSIYTLGTEIESTVFLDKVSSFKKTNLSLDSSNVKRLEMLNSNYKNLLIQKEPFLFSCYKCFMKDCVHKKSFV